MVFEEFLLGVRERISWVPETSYGSGGSMAADGVIVGLNARIEPDFNQNWQEVLSAGADSRSVEDRVLGPLALPFNLVFNVDDWRFLQYLGYGNVDAGSDPYTHTFTLQNAIQSFNLEWALRHTTPVVITLLGGFANSGVISFAKSTGEGNEGFITVTLQCFAKGYSIGSSVTTLASGNITTKPVQWRHAKLTLETSEIVELNNGEITISQGIDPNDSRYANSTLDRELGTPIPKVQRVSARFNVNFKDDTYIQMFDSADVLSGTNKLEFIRGTNDNIDLSFSNLRVGQGFPSTALEGVTAADIVNTSESFSSLVATDSVPTY